MKGATKKAIRKYGDQLSKSIIHHLINYFTDLLASCANTHRACRRAGANQDNPAYGNTKAAGTDRENTA
ncbi:hypothetical protein D3C76_1561920 [compost metagenome]